MIELIRSTDPVLLSFIESLLKEGDIIFMQADFHTSILEGSLGVLPRRILVDEDDFAQAKRILRDEGLLNYDA